LSSTISNTMKKIIIVTLLLLPIVYLLIRRDLTKKPSPAAISPTKAISIKKIQETKTIFVPYWSDSTKELDVKKYDRVVYFGFNADERGLITDGSRMNNLRKFIENTPNKNKLLTLIMTNTDVNLNILKNKESWEKIIKESVALAKENDFIGIVLDLEMSFIPLNNETTGQLNNFVEKFAQEAKNNELKLSMTIYGDVFYRHRPYDVKTIAQNIDEIMIMAYDLHKSQGEPGANFPLISEEDYDFQKMVKDFTSVVSAEKLTVIFGMYGYDWAVDEKKRPLNQAKSLTLNEIRQQFLSKCE
jgi:spore germination protein YaaH